jgi:peptidoglycan/LPS O-acetylase OafA/YrhL
MLPRASDDIVKADECPVHPTAAEEIGLSRARTFIPELESVRGIAVLLVVAFHLDRFVVIGRSQVAPSLPYSFVQAGHTGVDLFFLLSGFLLSLPFIAAALGGKPVSVRTYCGRRVLRILPLYYAAVLVGAVMKATTPSDLLHALPYLVFLNGIGGIVTPLNPYSFGWWSLATEAQFYLVLPLLPFLLRTRQGRMAGAALLALYALVYASIVTGRVSMQTIDGELALLNSVLGRGPLFLWGIAAAFLYHTRGDEIRERLARIRWLSAGGADVLLVFALLALAIFLQWVCSIGPTRQMGAADQPWHIVEGGLWAVFLLLLLLFPLRAKWVVCNAAMARLGILSYSIYLVHVPVIRYGLSGARHLLPSWGLVGWHATTGVVVLVLLATCYGIATLTYRYIERPFLARKARLD